MTSVLDSRHSSVIVIHETNGPKYLEALTYLQERGIISSIEFYEASIVWKFFHGVVREKRSIASALRGSLRNLRFRLACPRVHGKTIVICLPPWDARFLFYAALRRKNNIVYNTSWPRWRRGPVPRKAGLATGLLRGAWLRVLRDRNVALTAVTDVAGDELGSLVDRRPAVIPHVVSDVFFERNAAPPGRPFRIVFVGELVESRGLATIRDALALLAGEAIVLDVVGDGPLRAIAQELARATGGTWHGRVSDRAELARIVSSAHVLLSPSIRTARWEELFGMALIEAMACGVPCIVSDHVGPRTLVEHGVSGVLLPERSPAAIAAWIRTLMRDADVWTRMSVAAKARAERSRLSAVAMRWQSVLGLVD